MSRTETLREPDPSQPLLSLGQAWPSQARDLARDETLEPRAPHPGAAAVDGLRDLLQTRSAAASTGAEVSRGSVVTNLPELLDAKALQAELGVTRAAAEAIMRRLPVVQFEGLRKVYVSAPTSPPYIEARTFSKDAVPS